MTAARTRRFLKVPFHEDEHLNSFASRTACANGRWSLRGFLFDFGIDAERFLRGQEAQVREFANLLEMPPAHLLERSFAVDEDRSILVNGNWLSGDMVVRHRFRFCSHCLLHDERNESRMPGTRQYGRIPWVLTSVRTCHIHNRQLSGLDQSHYVAADFSLLVDMHRGFVAEEANKDMMAQSTDFETYVIDRMSGGGADGGMLNGRSLSVAIELSGLVGMASRHGHKFKSRLSRLVDDDEARACLETGFQILRAGRLEFDRLLDTLSSAVGKAKSRSGQAVYGRLYTYLEQTGADFEFAREAVRTHAEGRGIRLRARIDGPWRTITSIAAETGRSHTLTRDHLVRAGWLEGYAHSRAPKFIPMDVAEQVVAALNDRIGINEVATLLKCPRHVCHEIEKESFIVPMVGTKRNGEPSKNRYARSQILEFRVEIEGISRGESQNLKPLSWVSRHAQLTQGRIICMLLKGELKSSSYSDNGPMAESLFVDLEEVKSAGGQKGFLKAAEVYRRLGVHANALRAMAESGLVATVERETKLKPILASEVDVAEIDRDHISISKLGAENGLSAWRVLSGMRHADVSPSIPVEKTGAIFIRRTDIDRVLTAARKVPTRRPRKAEYSVDD